MPERDLGRITPEHIRQADRNLTNGPPPPKWKLATRLLLHSAALVLIGLMVGRAFQRGDPTAGLMGVAATLALIVHNLLLEKLKGAADE